METITHYLEDLALLEGQLYTQNSIISSLERRIRPLGYANTYEKPKWYPWKPDLGDFLLIPFVLIVGGCIPGTVVVWFVAGLLDLFLNVLFDLRIHKATASLFETIGSSFNWYIRTVIVLSIIGVIWNIYSEKKDRKEDYKKALQEYDTSVKNDKLRVQYELALRKELQNQMGKVISERNKTQETINAMYNVGVIHPKYRYMVAVASFFDYFDTGRCFSFTGPGGAYAVYEEDLRFQRIVTKLDIIISKLDELIQSQRKLAELMWDANNTLHRIEQSNNRMMQSVSQIEANSELIEYNSRCAMQSSAVMEHIMVYQALKND